MMIMEIFLILIKKELKSSFALKMILAKIFSQFNFSNCLITHLICVLILGMGKVFINLEIQIISMVF